MRRLVVFITVLLTTWTALVARSSSSAVPDILISRQLFERERLAIGQTVELSHAADGTARQFRVAGIYEPTPDPMRFAQERLEVRVHLPDAAALDEGQAPDAGSLTAVNLRLANPADADRFASDVERRLPGLAARSTSAPDERTSTFAVLDRFHLAIAIVTILGSGAFLLALMVMLVDERRETAATLRLIGLTKRRLIAQILVEGALIAAAGALFGILFAIAAEPAFNRFFQWRYDTALVFVRVTPAIAIRCVAVAVPVGLAASAIAGWTILRRRTLFRVAR
jgi:ABC-type lipoprotein release transport system permease subunit